MCEEVSFFLSLTWRKTVFKVKIHIIIFDFKINIVNANRNIMHKIVKVENYIWGFMHCDEKIPILVMDFCLQIKIIGNKK